MASIKQIEANRSNALNGAGPRTAEGKARSSRNALTHGLTAQEILIPGEDVAAYRLFERQLIDDLQPDGSCELDLIERLAATYWRLRRIPRFEAALMAWREHDDFGPSELDRSEGETPAEEALLAHPYVRARGRHHDRKRRMRHGRRAVQHELHDIARSARGDLGGARAASSRIDLRCRRWRGRAMATEVLAARR